VLVGQLIGTFVSMELRWHRNSTGWVGDFPLGRGWRFVARRVKTGCR